MARTKKDFDCVEMKEGIQQKIRADYEAHKHEFASYGEFMEARIRENPWASGMLAELAGKEVRAPRR